jgi:hypothetical protein
LFQFVTPKGPSPPPVSSRIDDDDDDGGADNNFYHSISIPGSGRPLRSLSRPLVADAGTDCSPPGNRFAAGRANYVGAFTATLANTYLPGINVIKLFMAVMYKFS